MFYGAAECSRDCDVVILADEDNFKNLNAALSELQAECIAIPESVMTLTSSRPWLSSVGPTDFGQIEKFLRQEEELERRADEAYWKPLKEELVQLRLNRERQSKD